MTSLRRTDVKKHLGRIVPRFNGPAGQTSKVKAQVDAPIKTKETASAPQAVATIPKAEAV